MAHIRTVRAFNPSPGLRIARRMIVPVSAAFWAITVANQYLAQMDEHTSDAIFGNVGSLVCFQVGPQDAEILAEQLAGDVRPEDLISSRKRWRRMVS